MPVLPQHAARPPAQARTRQKVGWAPPTFAVISHRVKPAGSTRICGKTPKRRLGGHGELAPWFATNKRHTQLALQSAHWHAARPSRIFPPMTESTLSGPPSAD